jgi:Ca2+-binding RTX toxin-like protein
MAANPGIEFFSSEFRSSSEKNGAETYSLHLTETNDTEVSVEAHTVDGTATRDEDYVPRVEQFVFPAGTAPNIIYTSAIQILPDSLVEDHESFQLELRNPTGGAVLGPQSTAQVIINNDDGNISVGDATVTEGGVLQFAITLDASVDVRIELTAEVSGGTATSPDDFTARSEVVEFGAFLPAGQTRIVEVPTVQDNVSEAPETITLTLRDLTFSNGTPGTITVTDGEAVGTITDNDNTPPSISSYNGAATASVSVAENAGTVADVDATDPDAGQQLQYFIVGGNDAEDFNIDRQAGTLSALGAPFDFEAPRDNDFNNVYQVVVEARDGANGAAQQSLTITVTDVAEPPPGGGGTSGSDTFAGTSGSDLYDGGAGKDRISGGLGDDILIGGTGNDTVQGGAGNDRVSGGPGVDNVSGDAGTDTYVFREGDGRDSILNFSRGQDRIELNVSIGTNHIDNFAELQALAHVTRASGGTQIVFDGGDTLLVQGMNGLAGQDWIFV